MLGLAKVSSPDQQVIRLVQEKTMLRLRVQELEQPVVQMQLLTKAKEGNALKKCKSFNAE